MRTSVAFRARVADVLLGRDGVLVVVDGGDATGGAEVVAGDLQRALAALAVVGLAQPRVAVEAFHASVALLAHRVVLAFLERFIKS